MPAIRRHTPEPLRWADQPDVRIRIGFGFGGAARPDDHDAFGHLIDDLERLGFDSLWVSERAGSATLDPMVAA